MENWKEVIGFEGFYEISNKGNIRSLNRTETTKAGWKRERKGRALSCFTGRDGRIYADLIVNSVRKRFQVHHLVLCAFLGPRPEGTECCHNDGNAKNNEIDNLRWDTHQNNIKDKEKHGTGNKGSKHGLSKLKESDIPKIRSMISEGIKHGEIGRKFGVSRSLISYISRGDRWAHV